MRAVRQGGTISFEKTADSVAKIESSNDKIAAELALVRLKSELHVLENKMRARESEIQRSAIYLDHFQRDLFSGTSLIGEAKALIGGVVVSVLLGYLFGAKTFLWSAAFLCLPVLLQIARRRHVEKKKMQLIREEHLATEKLGESRLRLWNEARKRIKMEIAANNKIILNRT